MNLTKLLLHTELLLLELAFMVFYIYSTRNILRMNLSESNKCVYLLIAMCSTNSENTLHIFIFVIAEILIITVVDS